MQDTKLAEIIDVLGITQTELARRSGVSVQTIRALMRGTHPPSLPTAQAITNALGGATIEAVFPSSVPPEVVERGLSALAHGIKQTNPGAVVEVEA